MSFQSIILPKRRRDLAAAKRRGHLKPVLPEEIQSQQFEALKRLWADAVADVPYYAALVDSGQAPRELESWSDFETLPVLTRQALKAAPEAFIRRSRAPEKYVKTAGSTGTPLKIGVDQAEAEIMRLVKLAAWQEFGYDAESRLFLIWGHLHLLGTRWRAGINHLRRTLADRLMGYRRVNAYRLNREDCQTYAESLLRFKPLGVIGYTSALDLFARHTHAYREQFRALDLGFVLVTSEPPPKPDSIALLEDHFGCPVVQEYGGAEFGQVAFKTGDESFLVYSDLNYVETGDPENKDADTYPLLLTSLYPRYLPLFRYAVGDAVQDPTCLANGHVVSFDSIAGRASDTIELSDGDSIHSVSIFHCIHDEKSVHNIQMLVRDDGIEIRLIADLQSREEVKGRILQRLTKVHPLLGQATISFSEDLVTNRAGKRRWFVDQRHKP
jgi:phenylacetate-CoA ligase